MIGLDLDKLRRDICASGLHCVNCRNQERGARFRDAHGLQECPHGKPWGWTKPPEPEKQPVKREAKQGIRRVMHGAFGLTKWAFGRGRTPPDILEQRRAICNQCPKKTKFLLGYTTKCTECGCLLPAKQEGYSEFCPLGKWDLIDRDESGKVVIRLPVIS